ncbi:hypothetical protein BCR39DRAFT_103586 [Naematelia encephala]|uniref:Uncharacterized protein n=1 Tax=Naematelia encephala TaxID=71784 RepID=A0A1Y2B870_9TREE|nr:hypothetical protein BCR39DRAFT_103586 [Naematelia encephala]
MPLHSVPIIIGTTIALVGSGYAFKKFIYDPHLAPLLEALLAAHSGNALPTPRHRRPSHSYESIPIRAQAVGATTARRDHQTNVRRRSAGRREALDVHELREPLISGRSTHPVIEETAVLLDEHNAMEGSPRRGKTADLIDLSLEDAEVREVVFNIPTPIESRAASPPPLATSSIQLSTPESMSKVSPSQASRSIHLPPEVPSTTFSFLSLSQASSPDTAGHQMPLSPIGRLLSINADRSAWEDDVISIHTSTSGYEDAEAYSPISGAMSPARLHASPRIEAVQELGLRFVSPEDLDGVAARRGALSVISMSDDEGWGADSDWDGARSEAEAAR